jgi:predicted HAD superfamily phosphohydrolase
MVAGMARVSNKRVAGILAVRYSAMARESAERAREMTQRAMRAIDAIVEGVRAHIEAGRSVDIMDVVIELRQVQSALRVVDEYISEAQSFAALSKRNAEECLGRALKPQDCARSAECGFRECKPETCGLFTLKLF